LIVGRARLGKKKQGLKRWNIVKKKRRMPEREEIASQYEGRYNCPTTRSSPREGKGEMPNKNPKNDSILTSQRGKEILNQRKKRALCELVTAETNVRTPGQLLLRSL